jgi:hypothetical protein
MILGGRVRSTLLPDNRVFIFEDGNAAEIYDPASGTFALTSAYTSSSPVLVDTATLLPDGGVLVAGCAAQCSVGMTGVYDSHTGMFSATGPRRAWDAISTATLLINGTVLLWKGMIMRCRTTQKSTTPPLEYSHTSGSPVMSTSSLQPRDCPMERF